MTGPAPRRNRRFVVWPHHPDMLQRPALGLSTAPSVYQALTWNIFRTLELMPPAFWLRRLNATLGIEPPRPASVTVAVRLWQQLRVPPEAGGPRQPPVEPDVLIETEHAVWSLLVCHAGDVVPAVPGGDTDPLAMQAYAASWYAGRRDCYVGLVVAAEHEAPLGTALVRRYCGSPGALRLRVPARGHDPGNIRGLGMTTWERLIAIVRDVSCADMLDDTDRRVARRALDWCEQLDRVT